MIRTLSLVSILGLVCVSSTMGQGTKKVKVTGVEQALKKYALSLPMKKSDRGALRYLQADVDGQKAWLLLDSGSMTTVVAKHVAEMAGIKLAENGHATGATGVKKKAYQGTVKSMRFKGFALNQLKVGVLDLSDLHKVMVGGKKYPYGGLLGINFLSSASAVVDYEKNRLLMPKVKIKGGISGLYEKMGYPSITLVKYEKRFYFPVKLGGKEALFICDTGANQCTIIPGAVKQAKGVILEKEVEVTSFGSRDKKVKMVKIPEFKLGSLKLKDALFLVINTPVKRVDGVPVVGVIGGNIFDATKALIDLGEGKVVFGVGKNSPN